MNITQSRIVIILFFTIHTIFSQGLNARTCSGFNLGQRLTNQCNALINSHNFHFISTDKDQNGKRLKIQCYGNTLEKVQEHIFQNVDYCTEFCDGHNLGELNTNKCSDLAGGYNFLSSDKDQDGKPLSIQCAFSRTYYSITSLNVDYCTP